MTLINIAACFFILTLFFLCIFLFRLNRNCKKLEVEIATMHNNYTKQENLNNIYAREINSMGNHLSKIESTVYGMDDRLHKIKSSSTGLNNYQQATLIFKKGGSLEEVLGACSISIAEAKFVQSLVQKESQV